MQIHILGPLEVLDDDLSTISLPPKPKRLLAMMAIDVDRAIPVNSLVQELWGDNPPRTAAATIQTYIGQIRRAFADALDIEVAEVAETVLVTQGSSYLLSGVRVSLDITEFYLLADAGRAAIRDGEFARGAELLDQAISLWRGAALVNIEAGELLSAQIMRLEESLLCSQEQRILAGLQGGEHHTLVADLIDLTARHPLHENLHRHLMLALYRSGRRAEALAVMRRLRAHLVKELGLDPSPFLVQLEGDILRCDASLDADSRRQSLTPGRGPAAFRSSSLTVSRAG